MRRGTLQATAPPEGLVADRFTIDGIEYVAFGWEIAQAVPELSQAQRAVFDLLLTGASNAEIATARNTSLRTVANQVATVLKKVGASSRFELIARFAKQDQG